MSPSSTVLSSLIFIIHTAIANQEYFVISNDESPLNWEEANSMCDTATTRGQLASSHNASHDTIMHDLCKSTGSDSCWIGLYRESSENEWKWMDNSELSHTPNSISTDNTLKSCISLITSSDQPTWSDGDCLKSLSSAICSTCGNMNEYCCNIGNQCNGDNMECIDNQCMELPESTDYYFPKPTTSYYFVGTTPKKGLHIDHPSTVAIVVVVIVVIVFNVICCAIKKRKQQMIDDYEYEEHKKELEKATLNRVKSNETPGEDEKDERNESDIRMDMGADTDEAEEEEQKYHEN